MCGIAGVWRFGGERADTMRCTLQRMTDCMRYRGPDSSGEWIDEACGIGLGHRRLAIIDLSPSGHQPMASSDGRYVISYNGEVYNFPDLRRELEATGHSFRGTSDTEAMLEGFRVWGVEQTVSRLVGMFAFALWDRKERALTLVRDRMGVKPLYWAMTPDAVLFGSELKALHAYEGWGPRIDAQSLVAYLRFGYVPAPRTIYRDVHKVQPATLLRFSGNRPPEEKLYWDLEVIATGGHREDLSDEEATNELEHLLRDAIRRRMIADVPLGAFLSGGIDSSAVVALMQAESNRPVRTFTIGFPDAEYDEADHARAVARHLNTEHTELRIDPQDARDVVPLIPDIYDEPFADSSQIPTYLVSKMARAHVTVSLSGDGGDEVFGGYNRYLYAEELWGKLHRVPRVLRRAAACTVHTLSADAWDRVGGLIPRKLRPRHFGLKLHKLAEIVAHDSATPLYRALVSQHGQPGQLAHAAEPPNLLSDARLDTVFPDLMDRMRYADLRTYLPDDILVKVDRASMAVSLEAREPLLDHRVVAFAWRLPRRMLIRDGETKWLLRQVLFRHVPRALIERAKMGFGVPLGDWLRGPLRDWAEDLLAETALAADGLLRPMPIRRMWHEHLSQRQNHQYALWTILMFQAWRRRWPAAVA